VSRAFREHCEREMSVPTYYTSWQAVRLLDTTMSDFFAAAKALSLLGRVIDGARVWSQTELDRIREEIESDNH
jgi:hypothetical protein